MEDDAEYITSEEDAEDDTNVIERDIDHRYHSSFIASI